MGLFGASGAALAEGDAAPDFALQDQDGRWHRLTDYHGRWLILYFYPKDDTPGCTKEACGFRDRFTELREAGVAILGVSLDDAASHARFSHRYELSFPLLSDVGGLVAAEFGALMSLGPLKYTRRHSFVIDPEGNIVKIYRKVRAAGHSQQVLEDIRVLQAGNVAEGNR